MAVQSVPLPILKCMSDVPHPAHVYHRLIQMAEQVEVKLPIYYWCQGKD